MHKKHTLVTRRISLTSVFTEPPHSITPPSDWAVVAVTLPRSYNPKHVACTRCKCLSRPAQHTFLKQPLSWRVLCFFSSAALALTCVLGIRVTTLHLFDGDEDQAAQIQAQHVACQRPSGCHLYGYPVFIAAIRSLLVTLE